MISFYIKLSVINLQNCMRSWKYDLYPKYGKVALNNINRTKNGNLQMMFVYVFTMNTKLSSMHSTQSIIV